MWWPHRFTTRELAVAQLAWRSFYSDLPWDINTFKLQHCPLVRISSIFGYLIQISNNMEEVKEISAKYVISTVRSIQIEK